MTHPTTNHKNTDSFQQKLLLGAVSLGVVMDAIDGSIVNVALPQIAVDFATDTGTIAWVIIVYLLMMAGLLPIFGTIADRGYMKKIFISGIALFTIASFICSISPGLSVLLGGRIIQGVGAAMIAAVAPLICVRHLPPRMLAVALGTIAAASSIGFAAGPPIGGILTHYLSWHWIFLINIPIGIFGILFVMRVIPKDSPANWHPAFDSIGAVALFGAMASGIFALNQIGSFGLTNPRVLFASILCLIFLSLFIVREHTTPSPFLDIRIFKKWQFTCVTLAFLLLNVVFIGIFYILPFYLTTVMGFSIALSGMYLFIPSLVTCITSIPFSRLSDRYGRRWFVVIACLILIIVNAIYTTIRPEAGTAPLVIALILMGLVYGISAGPASSRIIETTPRGAEGMGSTLMVTSIYLAGVVGTALYAMIFTFTTTTHGIVALTDIDYTTFLSGFHSTMAIGLAISVVPLVLSLLVKDEKQKTSENIH